MVRNSASDLARERIVFDRARSLARSDIKEGLVLESALYGENAAATRCHCASEDSERGIIVEEVIWQGGHGVRCRMFSFTAPVYDNQGLSR